MMEVVVLRFLISKSHKMPSWKRVKLPSELQEVTNLHEVTDIVSRLFSIADCRIASDVLLDYASNATPFDYALVTGLSSLHPNTRTSQFAATELLSVVITPQHLVFPQRVIPDFLRLFRRIRHHSKDEFTARLIRIAEARVGDRRAIQSLSNDFAKPCGTRPGGTSLYRTYSIQCLDRLACRQARRALVRIANLNVHESDRINAAAILIFHESPVGVDLVARERLRSDLSDFEQIRTLFLLAFSGDEASMRQLELLCQTLPLEKPLQSIYQQINLYRCLTRKRKPFFDRLIAQIESRFDAKELPQPTSVSERRVLILGR